jgi:hypothetical protein
VRFVRLRDARQEKIMEIQTLPELDDLQSRLRLDYQVVTLMRSPLLNVEAYQNEDDLKARRNLIRSLAEGHLATYYRVDYHIKTLIGPGHFSNTTTVMFDLFADNNYPDSEPVCSVIESPTPWSPHFYENVAVCTGDGWKEAEGRMLLGELMVHVAKLLNFDEPPYKNPNYVGYNGEAIKYWESVLGRQPLTKNLPYPVLPTLVPSILTEEERPKAFVKRKMVGAPSPVIKIKVTGQVTSSSPRIRIRPHSGNPD